MAAVPSALPASPSARRRARRRTRRGGSGTGRRHRAARSALCNAAPPTSAIRNYPPRTCAKGVQAARRRPGDRAARRRCRMRRPPPVEHPHPRAGGRSDGRRAASGGTGRRDRTARSEATRPCGCIARRNRATGVQAARRRPGEVAARQRSPILARGLPRGAHPPPHAGGRGDRPRRGWRRTGRRSGRTTVRSPVCKSARQACQSGLRGLNRDEGVKLRFWS
jgi:hypothetical protein